MILLEPFFRSMRRKAGVGQSGLFKPLVLSALFAPSFLPPAATAAPPAELDPVTVAFSAYDPNSAITLDHAVWDALLSKTVVFAGRSRERLGHVPPKKYLKSNLTYGDNSPSRFENNRVVLHRFDDTHRALVTRYREGLEHLPERLPLARLNRAEQLAFWLNLYNARVMEALLARYPIRKLTPLRREDDETGADVWHERSLRVAGQPLSLRDIETRILFPVWHNPLVLYGLWQGSVGGPRLPTRAYTGQHVWEMLESNAAEFINSNRGFRPDGDRLRVSRLYRWGAALFPNDTALLRHLARYAVPPFSNGMEQVQTIERSLYNWHVADLIDGTYYQGQWNQLADFALRLPPGVETQFGNFAIQKDTTRRGVPPQMFELIRGMAENNDRGRTPRVTVEECPREEGCEPEEEKKTPPPD